MQLVYIEWEDAGSLETGSWIFRDEASASTPHIFRQVGFVSDCDPWAICLTEAYSADQMAPRTRIPLGMVRRFVELDPGPRRESQCL